MPYCVYANRQSALRARRSGSIAKLHDSKQHRARFGFALLARSLARFRRFIGGRHRERPVIHAVALNETLKSKGRFDPSIELQFVRF